MEKNYIYKEQSDLSPSWICEEIGSKGELVNKYMVYEDPNLPEKDFIDLLTEERIEKLKTKLGIK